MHIDSVTADQRSELYMHIQGFFMPLNYAEIHPFKMSLKIRKAERILRVALLWDASSNLA